MEMLTLSHVSKSFGKHKVLDDLSFSVPQHSVFGFIGQNGAGKTTTMKLILGLLKADGGQILVNGKPVTYGQNDTNRYIDYLPDVPEFYGFLTPAEYLKLIGRIAGMSKADTETRSRQLLDLVGLSGTQKRIHGFSRGMKQRLGIAQALLGRPRLLICDEPTSALDPVGRKEILDILSHVKEETTVLFSTHILSDVERICDEIALLHRGKIAFSGTFEELRRGQNQASRSASPDSFRNASPDCSRAVSPDSFHSASPDISHAAPSDISHATSSDTFNPGEGAGFKIEFLHQDGLLQFSRLYPQATPLGHLELLYEGKQEADMMYAIHLLSEHNIPVRKVEMCEFTLEHLFMSIAGDKAARLP